MDFLLWKVGVSHLILLTKGSSLNHVITSPSAGTFIFCPKGRHWGEVGMGVFLTVGINGEADVPC